MPGIKRLLLLGGTAEARLLAKAAQEAFGTRLTVITSLAGRLPESPAPVGLLRVGGFGGAEGMADYLCAERIDLAIDATHPFAATISAHARKACDATQTPRLLLLRPMWQKKPEDRWVMVDTWRDAASRLPQIGARAFVAIGIQELDAFANLPQTYILARLAARPAQAPALAQGEIRIARGPFLVEDELRLLQDQKIDVIVCKASGGASSEGKLIAARKLQLPVIMKNRPPPEPGPTVATPQDALDWLRTYVS